MSELPFISILTPIFNRTKWLPLMLYNLQNLDYPKDKLEWVILDTYDNNCIAWDKLFKNKKQIQDAQSKIGFKINYQMNDNSYTIGDKRNKLVKQATHKICANMDSDDAMLPSWLKHSIEVMRTDKKCGLVGTPEMTFVFPLIDFKITAISCKDIRMMHEAGMVFTKKHHRAMGGFGKASSNEGTGMIDHNENKCLRTDADKVIICVCHNDNTICKDRFKDKSNENVRLGGKIKDVIESIVFTKIEI